MGKDQLPTIPQMARLIQQLFLFMGMDEAQIAHIVIRFKPVLYKPDKVILAQGQPGSAFYIVYKGRVRVDSIEKDDERFLGILGPGEYFGEEALLYNSTQNATVTTLETTILLEMDRDLFALTLLEFPLIKKFLTISAESRHIAKRQDFDWLNDDEVVHLLTRKHEIFLVLSLIPPLLTFLLGIPLLAYGVSFLGDSSLHNFAAFGGALALIASSVWLVWNWVDWGNDFYVVTNQRVVRVEKVVLLYNSRREAPLHHVLSINVNKTWFGRVLRYGDIEVRTFTGGIQMPKASNPDLFPVYIEGFKARAGYLVKQADQELMRRLLRERMGLPLENGNESSAARRLPTRRKPQKPIRPGSLRDIIRTLFVVQYEQDKVITYRKHWLLLLGKTWIPMMFMFLLAVLVIYQIDEYLLGRPSFFSTAPMFLLYAIGFLAFFGWWVYGYLDWSNDIYQLAPDQIRDIERKPLGDEIKKTAPLESILSIEHFRDGIIQLYFNYGNVIINVGEARFIFRGVYNPDHVHQDVSSYIEALTRRKQEAEAQRERERMLDWLMTYKDQDELLELAESESDWEIVSG